MPYCRKCGAELAEDAKFCPACGTPHDASLTKFERSRERRPISTLAIVSIIIVVVVVIGAIAGFLWFWSGNLKTEEMAFSDFTVVKVGWAFDVEITPSSSYSVVITGDERIWDLIQVTQTGDTLNIGFEPSVIPGNLERKAKITMPELYVLELSGATHGAIDGFTSTNELVLSGASHLDMTNMLVGDLEIRLSGASHLEGQGSANDLDSEVGGASHLDLSNFPVHNANVNLSGASHATINLDGGLDADVSGASNLQYTGDPVLGDIQTSGGSTVSKK